MKSFRLFTFALILSTLFVFDCALANKGVLNAKITPDELLTNTPTVLTITVQADSEMPQLTSVEAYLTSAEGIPISKLGKLQDTGQQGDVTASDNIYTLQVTINRPNRDMAYVRVNANVGDNKHLVNSQILPLAAYDPIPTKSLQQFEADLRAIKNEFLQRLPTMPIKAARLLAYHDAKQNPTIQQAHLDGPFLSVVFKYGVRGSIVLDEYETVAGSVNTADSDNFPASAMDSDNDRVLIFAPGYSDVYPQNQIADLAKNLFSQSDYLFSGKLRPTLKRDRQASLEAIKRWGSYRAVVLHTHGGVWRQKGEPGEVFLLTGTPSVTAFSHQYSIDLSAGRIGIKGVDRFVVFPSFIAKHAVPMKDTFFYLGACYSLANDSFWEALKARGAKLAFGWSNRVARGFNADKFSEVLTPMLSTQAATNMWSAKQAYVAVADKVDGWCLFKGYCVGGDGALLTLKTAAPEWDSFAFSESRMANNSQ